MSSKPVPELITIFGAAIIIILLAQGISLLRHPNIEAQTLHAGVAL